MSNPRLDHGTMFYLKMDHGTMFCPKMDRGTMSCPNMDPGTMSYPKWEIIPYPSSEISSGLYLALFSLAHAYNHNQYICVSVLCNSDDI